MVTEEEEEEQSLELPKFISVDDHVVEPHGLWQDRLPSKYKQQGPACSVKRVRSCTARRDSRDSPFPTGRTLVGATSGTTRTPCCRCTPPSPRWAHWPPPATTALTYDDMLPGCFDQGHRLADMDAQPHRGEPLLPDGAPVLRPALPQSARHGAGPALRPGVQRLHDRGVVRRRGRRSPDPADPCPLVGRHTGCRRGAPMRRPGFACGGLLREPIGARTAEHPHREWEPFFAACAETNTVINMHIGSSSKQPQTSPGAPMIAMVALTSENSVHALVDWLLCGALAAVPVAQDRPEREPGRVDAVHPRATGQRLAQEQEL